MKLKFHIDSVEVKDMNGKSTGEKRARLRFARKDEESDEFGELKEIPFDKVPPRDNVYNVFMVIFVEYVDDQVTAFINALRPFFTVNSTNVTIDYLAIRNRSYDPEAFLRTLPPNCFKTISCTLLFNEMWNQLVDDQAPFFLDMPGELKMIGRMDDFVDLKRMWNTMLNQMDDSENLKRMFGFDDGDEASKSDDTQPIPADRKTKFFNYFMGATGEADKPRIAYYQGINDSATGRVFAGIKEEFMKARSPTKYILLFAEWFIGQVESVEELTNTTTGETLTLRRVEHGIMKSGKGLLCRRCPTNLSEEKKLEWAKWEQELLWGSTTDNKIELCL